MKKLCVDKKIWEKFPHTRIFTRRSGANLYAKQELCLYEEVRGKIFTEEQVFPSNSLSFLTVCIGPVLHTRSPAVIFEQSTGARNRICTRFLGIGLSWPARHPPDKNTVSELTPCSPTYFNRCRTT